MRDSLINTTQKTLIAFFAFVTFSVSAISADKLIMGWENYPPYQWQAEDGTLQGLDIEVVSAVAAIANFEIEYKNTPWLRMFKSSLKTGEVDIAFNAAMTEQRKSIVHYASIPYFSEVGVMLIQAKDKEKFKHIKNIHDTIDHRITIGVIKGHAYSDDYEALLNNPNFTHNLHFSAKEEQNIAMLVAGRLDAVFIGNLKINKLLDKIKAPNTVIPLLYLDSKKLTDGSFIIFSKATVSPEKVKRFNLALEQLHAEGKLKEIVNKYLPKGATLTPKK